MINQNIVHEKLVSKEADTFHRPNDQSFERSGYKDSMCFDYHLLLHNGYP